MRTWWALLFGVVNLACLGLFFVAPALGWWLPDAVSTHAASVDNLFYVILAITGFFFVLTEALLAYFIWKYGEVSPTEQAAQASRPREHGAVFHFFKRFVPNEHRLELAWTIVPAAILLYIAFAQVGAWADIKYQSRMPKIIDEKQGVPYPVAVSARQFEWRMRYPSPERWARWQEWKAGSEEDKKKLVADYRSFNRDAAEDDVRAVNELHVWTNEKAASDQDYPPFVVALTTMDVQHNFNIPYFRVKQDALPGKTIPVWFRPTKSNTVYNAEKQRWEDGGGWKDPGEGDNLRAGFEDVNKVWEIACAELCGRWHYHMLGRVYVHPSEDDFLNWLKSAAEKQGTTTR